MVPSDKDFFQVVRRPRKRKVAKGDKVDLNDIIKAKKQEILSFLARDTLKVENSIIQSGSVSSNFEFFKNQLNSVEAVIVLGLGIYFFKPVNL